MNEDRMEKLRDEVRELFSYSRSITFEDGMDDDLKRGLTYLIYRYGKPVLDIIHGYLNDSDVSGESMGVALHWIGQIDSWLGKLGHRGILHDERRELLEYFVLNAKSSRVKDGASLGLGAIDDPASIPAMTTAVNNEKFDQLKKLLQQVLDQLIETKEAMKNEKKE